MTPPLADSPCGATYSFTASKPDLLKKSKYDAAGLFDFIGIHNQTSVSPLTIKFTADPIPVPPASGAVISTDRLSVPVNTIG